MTAYTKTEKNRLNAINQSARDTESKANRLQKLIDECQSELAEIESRFDFRSFADESAPFAVHRAIVGGSDARRRDLETFIRDMSPVVQQIRDEATETQSRAKDIEASAQNRADLIKELEEESVLNGDLPKEKRELLTKLKAELLV